MATKSASRFAGLEQLIPAFQAAKIPANYDLRIGFIEGPPDLPVADGAADDRQALAMLEAEINGLRLRPRQCALTIACNFIPGVGLDGWLEEFTTTRCHAFDYDPARGEPESVPVTVPPRRFYTAFYGERPATDLLVELTGRAGRIVQPLIYPSSTVVSNTSYCLLWMRLLFETSCQGDGLLPERTQRWRRGDFQIAFLDVDPFTASLVLIGELLSEPDQPGATKPEPRPVVTLRGIAQKPLVDGVEVEPLSEPRYRVVEALIKAGPDGLSKPDLERVKGDAIKYLREIGKYAGWSGAIIMPGVPWARYAVKHV